MSVSKSVNKTISFWKIIALLFLSAGVVCRLVALGNIPGVNGDEAWLGWKAFEVAHGGGLDWRTNSGNITDPFYLLPLIALHHVFTPSVILLRSVAVISGLIALPLNYFFCRKIFGHPTAVTSTLLLALLPVCIVYSRFGWEPSQSILFSLPVLYLAFAICGAQGWDKAIGLFVGGCVAEGMALLVHPANFYLIGFLLAGLISWFVKPEISLKRLFAFTTLLFCGFAVMGIAAFCGAPPGVHDEIVIRLANYEWLHDGEFFLLTCLRIFNGINAVSYVSGSWSQTRQYLQEKGMMNVTWPDLTTLLIFLMAGIILVRSWLRLFSGKQDVLVRRELVLVGSFLFAFLLFDLFSGPEKIAVWNERYGLWAVSGGILILSAGWTRLLEMQTNYQALLKTVGGMICGMLLLMTVCSYFEFMIKTGGESESGFRVGYPECHEAAAVQIAEVLRNARKNGGTFRPVLVSSDWFVYWPIVYLLSSRSDTKQWETYREPLFPEYRLDSAWRGLEEVREGRTVFAEVPESPAWKVWEQVVRTSKTLYRTKEIIDLRGRPTLRIMIPEKWFGDSV